MRLTNSVAAALEQARARGLIVSERSSSPTINAPQEVPDEDGGEVPLMASVHVPPGMWLVGVATRSETNQRDWRKRSGRTQQVRRAVSRLFGASLRSLVPFAEHLHGGGVLRIVFTRLAPRSLDRGNISATLKAVEDALALMLGTDDGSPQWLASYEQETSARYGVKIVLEVIHKPPEN